MARIFEMQNGKFAVWGDDMSDQVASQDWILIAEYSEQDNPTLHHLINSQSTELSWNTVSEELSLNGDVVIDSDWIVEQQTTIANEEAELGFLTDIQAMLKAGYRNQDDVLTKLNNIQPILNTYPSHKAVVNNDIWPRARSMWEITLTLEQVSGDAQAAATYLWCIEHYMMLLSTFRVKNAAT